MSSLYTNIPHTEGIKACRNALLTRTRDDPHAWFVLTLLRFVLTLNYFEFQNVYYHQTSGTVMGTKLAPNYANIFMGDLEEKLLASYPTKPTVWIRYIDDIFCIFPDNPDKAQDFVDHLNKQHPTIKFTAEISLTSVNFLDTTVFKESDGSLSTKLYRKPTDTFQYLHYHSHHPSHQKKSIPYSQFVRVRRICTHKSDFFNNTDLMIKHMVARQYPMTLLLEAQKRAASLSRNDLLTPKNHINTPTVPLVTNHTNKDQDIQNIIRNSLFLLENARPKFSHEYKFLVTSKRSPNLKDSLVKSRLSNQQTQAQSRPFGSNPCTLPRCSTCQHVRTCTAVKSQSNGRTVKIPTTTNCHSTDIIYIIECNKCHKQYVGQTSNTLTTRLRQHLRDIRLKHDYKSIAQHFNMVDHNIHDVIIFGVDHAANLNTRLRLEEAWIHVIGTYQPAGLNRRD